MAYEADITIIGAGIVGLAIAAQLSGKGRDVYVLEKNKSHGLETSSRNSGVIHAGIYYPEGSLKARLCVDGNKLLYELCEKHAIPHKKIGKLIVASDDKETEKLHVLLDNGNKNGVTDLRLLSASEVKKLEPNIKAAAAILSPSTGIIDVHAAMDCFCHKAKRNGAIIAYGSEVIGIEKAGGGYKITMRESGGNFSFTTRILINCAGLDCDKIAGLEGIDVDKAGYRLHFSKGEYFWVGHGKNTMVSRLVYPVPPGAGGGLGVHVTLDLQGRMRLGPNAYYVDKIDYTVDPGHKRQFYESAARFLPFIEYDDIEPDMAGIRPKIEGSQNDFRDFIIRHEHDKGLPGIINLIGIESPGLTASPAIAKYVENILDLE